MLKKQYHHGDLKKSIIETAVGIIQTEGIKALSLRNVALEIGVSHSALYRHYKSREDLVVSIAINGFLELTNKLDMAMGKRTGDPLSQIVEMGREYIHYAVENPVYYKIMFGDYITNKTQYPELFQSYDALFRKVIDVLSKHDSGKRKKNLNHPVTAVSMWSLLHGYSCLIIDNVKDENVGSEVQINLMMEKLLMLI